MYKIIFLQGQKWLVQHHASPIPGWYFRPLGRAGEFSRRYDTQQACLRACKKLASRNHDCSTQPSFPPPLRHGVAAAVSARDFGLASLICQAFSQPHERLLEVPSKPASLGRAIAGYSDGLVSYDRKRNVLIGTASAFSDAFLRAGAKSKRFH